MRRSMLRSAAVLMTAGALVAAGTSSALAVTQPASHNVNVVGTGTSVKLSTSTVESGTVSFQVSTKIPASTGGSSAISLFRLNAGKTLSTVLRDIGLEFSNQPSQAAKGTRELTEDVTFFGLADVVQGHPETVTEMLSAGTYYLIDLGGAPPTGPSSFTKLTVRQDHDNDRARPVRSQFTVQLTSADRFVAPRNWAHEGTVTVANVSDTIHFMELSPVKAGTTDQQIQAFFDSGVQAPPPFGRQGPSGGSDVLSPGKSLKLTYDLPAGTYVLLCFVADDMTGMPHALMGMHKVVVLH